MNAEGQAIHNGQIEKIKAILSADQLPVYDQWRAERDRERQQRRQSEKK
jgi:hypothetical protein